MANRAGYTDRHLAIAPAKPKIHHRRHGGGDEPRPDQDRLALAAADRIAKYNQLLRIEEQLGDEALYAGTSALKALG